MIYSAGRILQIIGLLAMPSAIWAGHFGRNERQAITIFVASIAVFFAGYGLTLAGKPKEPGPSAES